MIVIKINSKKKDQYQKKDKMNIRKNRFFFFTIFHIEIIYFLIDVVIFKLYELFYIFFL